MEAPQESPTKEPSNPPAAAPPPPWGPAMDRLGAWSFYFIAKLLLLWRGLIGWHGIENLVFAVLLAGPLAAPRWRRWRPWFGIPVSIALLYHDSWLPRLSRVYSQAGLVASFSPGYLMELAGRFVSWPVLALLAAGFAAWFAISRFVRVDLLVAVALVAVIFLPPGGAPAIEEAATATPAAAARPPKGPEALLQEFYAKEAQRRVTFAAPPQDAPPFDLVFVHVCSLSWDDLQASGLAQHPLFKSFDLVLRRFNSASSYSGPAAIRLLRAPCGQPTHRALYDPAPEGCYLMPALAAAGFETRLALNHDGHFDDFLKFVRAQRVEAEALPIEGLPAPQRSFDQSRVYDDAAVLGRWLQRRPKDAASRVAVYYNTISLHDGNRLAADAGKTSLETYKARLEKLLDDLDGFMAKLQASGRRAVVVLVPEHGAAVRGDSAQIAGLREIPSPAITLVPVGIRVIGPGAKREGPSLSVDEPVSYLALAHIVSRMMSRPPYGAAGFRPSDYTAGMPLTDFVSENEEATVLERGGKYWLRQGADNWREYPAAAAR